MITAAVENLTERLEELKTFFPVHAAELDTYADRRPLAPQYGEYLRRDVAGNVLFVAVRRDGKIIAYWVSFVCPALHYETTLTCMQDIFFTLPQTRGRVAAAAAIAMFRAVIAECKRRGVKEIRGGHKLGDHDAAKLFKAFGFTPVETIHSLWLGE